jgi:hypothetical protein
MTFSAIGPLLCGGILVLATTSGFAQTQKVPAGSTINNLQGDSAVPGGTKNPKSNPPGVSINTAVAARVGQQRVEKQGAANAGKKIVPTGNGTPAGTNKLRQNLDPAFLRR